MAGIGFELRKIVKKDSLLSLAQMYGYSALLSSGAWVISIIAILVVGLINIATFGSGSDVLRYQVIVTYAFALAASLVVTGFIQLPFTRYIADLIFAKKEDEVFGNYFGVLLVVFVIEMVLFMPAFHYILPEFSAIEEMLVAATFLTLSAVWISNVLVSSMKYYHSILAAYFFTYGGIVVGSYYFGDDLITLLFIFFVGNATLFFLMLALIVRSYKPVRFIHFGFFKPKGFYYALGFAGLFYNMGTWADKFIFWYHPMTGNAVIGHINASVVYDLPIFIAYLSIIPGMAMFFYRLEADFAEKYDLFYDNVREGGTLNVIRRYRNEMVMVIRKAIREVIVVQAIVDVIIFLAAPSIFHALHIPQLYLGLFFILTVGALLQLGLMAVLALLFYIDRRVKAMWLSVMFFVSNTTLTLISIDMGPSFYGYGYAISLLFTFSLSIVVIRQTMKRLDYETFMLQ